MKGIYHFKVVYIYVYIYIQFSNSLKLYYQYIKFLFKSTTYILRICDILTMTLFLILGIATNMIFQLVHSSTMATLPGSKHGSKLIKNENGKTGSNWLHLSGSVFGESNARQLTCSIFKKTVKCEKRFPGNNHFNSMCTIKLKVWLPRNSFTKYM